MIRRGPRPVNVRLRRLLVMLPWLMERQTVSTQEMADHFGMSVADLVADLTLASMCGVSQDPRDLIDLWVDDDEVHFGIPKYFERPLRLTVPEAFSLIASATAAQQLPGVDATGALSRAIAKVAEAIDLDINNSFVVELETPESVEALSHAIQQSVVIEFEYWSVATGESAKRQVAPLEVFLDQDHWYLRAHDLDAQAERTFRLDRLDQLLVTSQTHDLVTTPRGQWFAGSDEQRKVLLQVDPAWLWVLEQYPGVSIGVAPSGQVVQHADWVTVEVVVNTERWMQRLLVRLGAHATVVMPTDWQQLGRDTAHLILQRYERTNG
jgi:predicted DNA-binding transcriptional regulator YafY